MPGRCYFRAMNKTLNPAPVGPNQAVQRLTALWAFSEAGLGGVLHAFSLPFTALSVGGIAVILITLMASYSERPFRTILRATIIVLVLKAAISPHTPVMAYFAVGFQGLLGAVVFGLLGSRPAGAVILGTVAMFESSMQKLVTLTVMYGYSLWEAIDGLFHYAGRQFGIATADVSLSYHLITGYVGLYIVGGMIIGWLAAKMVVTLQQGHYQVLIGSKALDTAIVQSAAVKKVWYKKSWLRYAALLLLLAMAMVFLAQGERKWQAGAYVIIRSLLVVSVWAVLLGPLLKKGIHRLLHTQQHQYAAEVEEALRLLPVLRQAAGPIWQLQHGAGWKRIWYFLLGMIHFSLTYNGERSQKKALQ